MSALVALWAPLLTLPAAAQRPGTVEVAAFARFTNFDNSLALDNTLGLGGQVTVYVGPTVGLELDISRASSDGPGSRSATYTPLRLRAVYSGPVGGRIDALVGGGFVRNWYGAPYDASDNGFSAIVGLRYRLNHRLGLRGGTDADVMFHTASDSPFDFYTGNWGIHLGVSVRLNPGSEAQ